MADIVIRGIEMPDNVEGCETIIRIQPNGEVLDAHRIHIGATAISLPEDHGRLIDADKLTSDKELNKITEDYRKITNKKFKEVKTNYRVDWDTGWFDHWLEN